MVDQLLKLGAGVGLSLESLERVDPKLGKSLTFDKSIKGFVDNRYLKIRARDIAIGDLSDGGASGGDYAEWEFYATWRCDNPHKVRMEIYPQGLMNKIRKKFKKQKTETLDNHLVSLSNQKDFPLELLVEEYYAELLGDNNLSGKISITKDGVRYTEKVCLDSDETNARLIQIITILRELAEMLDKWAPLH
ncbi:MAG: hypothetical protein GY810_23715 [Aureispira sp.]|nr:hypothetical protein [Aureispira sp.]